MNLRMKQLAQIGFAILIMSTLCVAQGNSQCSTCPTPQVAYQPVTYQAAQPVVAYRPYNGWYPGKLIDRWRSRGLSTAVPTYTTSYTPYTVGYATQQVAYRPCITSYAPLAPACHQCARPVVMRPILSSPCSTCGCDSCSTCDCSPCSCTGCSSCSSCSTCSTPVNQATYTEPVCSSCTAGGSTAGQTSAGPPTPQPRLDKAPIYHSNRPQNENGGDPEGSIITEGNVIPEGSVIPEGNGNLDSQQNDPGPVESSGTSTYFELQAPKLLDPSDRTALRSSSRKPTVDVWTAVYRKSTNSSASNTSHQVRPAQSQAEIDAEGWTAVAPRH